MKSVIEIHGQILFGMSFDIQGSLEKYLSEQHRAFLAMLRVIEEHLPKFEVVRGGRGRPRVEELPILRAFLAKSFFQIEATSELVNRLRSDSSLRRICGFTVVPSAATFSRRLKRFSEENVMERTLHQMVSEYHRGMLVGHINRDSTPIMAREKPRNKKTEVGGGKPRKRGRPRKGTGKAEKRVKRLAQQKSMRPAKALRELDHECAWGCKRNSQGNVQFWKGYKLHLDVSDMGIPITAVVTGANVHDSQVAIPMEKLTASRVTHLYSLMDSAYDAADIRSWISACGRKAIIEANKRGRKTAQAMDPATRRRYAIRSTVERSNAHLKDRLLPTKLLVKGHKKVSFCLLSGVVCPAAVKILQQMVLPEFEAAA
jgi:transposase